METGKNGSVLQRLVSVMHTNTKREKHTVISTSAEKAFEKLNTNSCFKNNKHSKVRICLSITEAIYKKTTVNINHE